MQDLAINLLASVIAGVAVWLVQKALRQRRLQRKRAFFGLSGKGEALLVVPRHASSPNSHSVNRSDVAALVELSAVVREVGALPTLVMHDQDLRGVGERTEFCVGGPSANQRTAAHLRWLVHGIEQKSWEEDPEGATLSVGGNEYVRVPDVYEYVIVAKVYGPDAANPVFILNGQTARTNHAAAKYLTEHYRQLYRTHRTDPFCLVLRIVDPPAYGNNVVELVKDLTDVVMPSGSSRKSKPAPAPEPVRVEPAASEAPAAGKKRFGRRGKSMELDAEQDSGGRKDDDRLERALSALDDDKK